MTDVRLTATNPEDSSVVPVACNAKGELKLEEVPTFDGNVDGDLTVAGSAEFASAVETKSYFMISDSANSGYYLQGNTVEAGKNYNNYLQTDAAGNMLVSARNLAITGTSRNTSISFQTQKTTGAVATPLVLDSANNATFGGSITAGSATFGVTGVNNSDQGSVKAFPVGRLQINGTVPTVGEATSYFIECNNNGADKFIVRKNGSVSFAGNKAGFTAEGYLWCTTRRGDTVILDFTSNGVGTWAPYTPPNRLTDLQDRWSEKDGILPVPHESSQDEP